MKKILFITLMLCSIVAMGQSKRKLFNLNINNTPPSTRRLAFGEDGILSENITLAEFYNLIVDNLNVYDKTEIDNFFLNYLSKTNTITYVPTNSYHPATKNYVDNSIDGVTNVDQGWTELTNGYRLQWFKFTSNIDEAQTVNFPYPFPNECVNVVMFGASYRTNVDLTITKNYFIFDRDDGISGSNTMWVQAIGY